MAITVPAARRAPPASDERPLTVETARRSRQTSQSKLLRSLMPNAPPSYGLNHGVVLNNHRVRRYRHRQLMDSTTGTSISPSWRPTLTQLSFEVMFGKPVRTQLALPNPADPHDS
eukprot:761526-Hanusia_phi.AAC.1